MAAEGRESLHEYDMNWYQQQPDTYIAMPNRLEGEMLVPYISPIGGGYFFALPGVTNPQGYCARALMI